MENQLGRSGAGRLDRMAKAMFLNTLKSFTSGFLEVVCPEETYAFGDAASPLRAMVVVHHQSFFRRAVFGGDVGMGESYMDGEWSSPDLVSVVRLAVRNLNAVENKNRVFSAAMRIFDRLRHRRNSNTRVGSRKNISYHYDLGNDFYSLFLDRSMTYSCAYYQGAGDTLARAQIQKFDRICRKLRLGPKDHVLEIGTGWGGWAAFAASEYGCRITTTTISQRQHEYARDVFQNLGEAGARIQLLLEDYRNLQGSYDKIVSIEMFEAVGHEHYDDYIGNCNRLLKPEGTMLLQSITINENKFQEYRKSCDWIQKYIFPGAELASVIEIQRSLLRCTSMQMFDMEDIGMHYAETLKAWRQSFQENLDAVRSQGFDDRFIRMWNYYLGYCEGAFRERHISDVQLVLTKTLNPAPMMNEPWREGEKASTRSAMWSRPTS